MNLQETPTTELVEIIRQRAEAWEKPDKAIWNELMTRYRWIGCPKGDRALIHSLDSVLRLLNNGRTQLPPGVIQVSGAGIPPPPPYYQKKISLSQVATVVQTKYAESQRFGQTMLEGRRQLREKGVRRCMHSK